MVCANRVAMLLNPQTANARRLVKAAKEGKRPCFVDMSFGRATKSLMLMDDGTVIGCALTYRTLTARLNAETADAEPEGGEKCESSDSL